MLATAGAAAAAAAGHAGGEERACLLAPVKLGGHAVGSGQTVRVPVGAVVYVELAESEKYLNGSLPRSFPWSTPVSSSPSILRPVALCRAPRVSTLPVRVSAFRASHPGTVRVAAPLAGAWRALAPARRRGLHAYAATVIVTGAVATPGH